MCGRFAQGKTDAIEKLLSGLNLSLEMTGFSPRWNIAPSAEVAVIKVNDQHAPVIHQDEWGIVPAWMSKASFSKALINARSETVFDKPAFKSSIKSRRCVVPINGFYEWQKTNSGKQPWYMYHNDGSALALAGLYQVNQDGVSQFALLTTNANELMQPVHHRMPVILKPDEISSYLDPGAEQAYLEYLMAENSNPELTRHAVSSYVSNARNEGANCAEPINI